jgi:cell division protein FtsB
MGSWFWLNFPLMLLFFCAWTGIPLWLVLTRWRREIEAKHAEIAAQAAAQAVLDLDELVSSVSDETVADAYEVTAS